VRFAYADPPYFRMGKKMYAKHHIDAPIWDDKQTHINLVADLCDQFTDGWALSCNPADLQWLLPACPDDCRIGAWVKTFHQIRPTTTQYAWEPVIWRGGRKNPRRSPMVRDWLSCARTNRTGTPGAKPAQFNRWVLDLLGFDYALDEIVDLFPGSGSMQTVLDNPRLSQQDAL
jgi:hypothetical protein